MASEQLELDFDQIEREVIDLWILMTCTKGRGDMEFSWEEITAIPQTHISVFDNLQPLSETVLAFVRSAMNYSTGTVEFVPKSKKLKTKALVKHREENLNFEDCNLFRSCSESGTKIFKLSTIIEIYRGAFRTRLKEISEKCREQLEKMSDQRELLESCGPVCASLEKLMIRYQKILDYLEERVTALPFRRAFFIKRIEAHYSDLSLLLEKHEHGDVSSKGMLFWSSVLSRMCCVPKFYRYILSVSLEQMNEWRRCDTEFLVRSFHCKYLLDSDATLKYSTEILSDEMIGSIRADIHNAFFDFKHLLEDSSNADLNRKRLSSLVSRAHEAYCSARVLKGAGESEAKKRKSDGFFESQERMDCARFYYDFSSCLYFFFCNVMVPLEEVPSQINFFTRHDEIYSKLKERSVRVSHLLELMRAYKPLVESSFSSDSYALELMISLLNQYHEKVNDQLENLFNAATCYQNRIMEKSKRLLRFSKSKMSLVNAELRPLQHPAQVDFSKGCIEFKSSVDDVISLNRNMEVLLSLIASAKFTNDIGSCGSSYPKVKTERIEFLERLYESLKALQRELLHAMISYIDAWIGRMTKLCNNNGIESGELNENFYLLSLYPRNRKLVLSQLRRLISVTQYGSLSKLVTLLSELHPEKAEKALERLKESPTGRQLLSRAKRQKYKIRSVISGNSNIFSMIIQYCNLSDEKSLHRLSSSCVLLFGKVLDILIETRSLESEFDHLSDFLKASSYYSDSESIRTKLRSQEEVLERSVGNLNLLNQLLINSADKPLQSQVSNRRKVAVFLESIQKTYHYVTRQYKTLSFQISNGSSMSDDEHLDRAHSNLLELIKVSEDLLEELQRVFAEEAQINQSLNAEDLSFKMLVFEILYPTFNYFVDLTTKLKEYDQVLQTRLENAGEVISITGPSSSEPSSSLSSMNNPQRSGALY